MLTHLACCLLKPIYWRDQWAVSVSLWCVGDWDRCQKGSKAASPGFLLLCMEVTLLCLRGGRLLCSASARGNIGKSGKEESYSRKWDLEVGNSIYLLIPAITVALVHYKLHRNPHIENKNENQLIFPIFKNA